MPEIFAKGHVIKLRGASSNRPYAVCVLRRQDKYRNLAWRVIVVSSQVPAFRVGQKLDMPESRLLAGERLTGLL